MPPEALQQRSDEVGQQSIPTSEDEAPPSAVEHDYLVEGNSVSPSTRRVEVRIFVPLLLIAAAIAGFILYLFGAWTAVGVGLVLLAMWYTVGWWPEVIAGIARRHEEPRS